MGLFIHNKIGEGMLIEAFENAFCQGCGMSLQDAMTSKRFSDLLHKEKVLANRHSKRTHRGLALRLGHMHMGTLLNTYHEKEALKYATSLLHESTYNAELRALTRYLGECIVFAAGECLPADVLRLADEWKTCDVDRQIEIAGILFERLISPSQEGGIMNEENFFKLAFDWMEHRDCHPRKILPKLYGMWGEGGEPNCQGKAQMLTAFGRCASTKVLCIDPIRDVRSIERSSFRSILDLVLADIEARGLEADAELQHSIDVTENYLLADTFRPDSYHVAVMLHLRDGRWVLIDPHCLTWGVLPAEWNIPHIAKMLEKYDDVLPGLSIASHDHGATDRWHRQRIQRTKELLERSHLMQAEIESAHGNPADLIDICKKSSHVAFMMLDAGMPPEFISAMGQESAAIYTLFGGLEDVMNPMRFAFDEEFRRKKIGSWLTYFHFTALDKAGAEHHVMARNGGLLHAICEFGLPEFHIGLNIVHSIANTANGNDVILREFMQENSFSQLQLGNALRGYLYGRTKDDRSYICAARAEQALRRIPFLHPICAQALKLVDTHNLLGRNNDQCLG